jgi:ADP-ribose pyrophosphatase
MVHIRARGPHPQYPTRATVGDEQVDWNALMESYNPPVHTDPIILKKSWADTPWSDMSDKDKEELGSRPSYDTRIDADAERIRITKEYTLVHMVDNFNKAPPQLPQNPQGRTGLQGRGLLGKYGANQAADLILLKDTSKGRQVALITRKDTGEQALPGGMVEGSKTVLDTMVNEFCEEALDSTQTEELSPTLMSQVKETLADSKIIYKGYVDDPRNTDHAWMNTTVFVCLLNASDALAAIQLRGGDDALNASWYDISEDMQLYANHGMLLNLAISVLDGKIKVEDSTEFFTDTKDGTKRQKI